MFNSFSGVGNGTFTTSCPVGYNLISCTFDNNLPSALEKYRKVEPIDSKTCQCYDYFAIVCIAWCTTLPLTSFELVCPKVVRSTSRSAVRLASKPWGATWCQRQPQPNSGVSTIPSTTAASATATTTLAPTAWHPVALSPTMRRFTLRELALFGSPARTQPTGS